ncbi:MAG: hypothetical protein FJX77_12190, partial [Armatimonadetes bacterium]|nr:hypothetical protein [Armatimonadota bacterium]
MRGLRWLLLMFLLGTAAPSAQAQGKAAWKARLIPADVRVGEQAQVVVEATIEPGWHIYSLTPISPGPRPIKLELDSSSSLKESGNPVQPPPHKKFDEGFKKEIEEFSGAVAFGIPVQITGKPGAGKAVVKVQYQACDPRMCLPPARVEVPVNFTVAGGAARPNRGQPVLTPPVQPAGYRKPDQAGGAEQTPLPNPAAAPGKTPLAAAVDAALQPPGGGDAEEDPDAPRVTWKLRLEPPDPRPGEAAQIVAEATIKKGWHIYSLTKFEPGPRPVQIELVPGEALRAEGPAVQPEPKKEFDQGFKKELEEFFGAVAFGIPVRVTAGPGEATARVKIQFQACDPRLCLPVEKLELPLQFTVVAGEVRTDRELAITTPPTQPQGYEPPGAPSSTPPAGTTATGGGSPPAQVAALPAAPTIAGSGGLLGFLWASIAAGFLALLTPCVFPMIPITVSFFSKQDAAPGSPAAEPKTDLKAAAAYCLGIIGTFTALGVGLSLVFGATGIQNLARNPWVNGLLAIVFLLLALTLFEVIHPRLPSGLIEKTQAGAGTGGVVGPILMGLTFSLTSFTCTVPFVGALLASASQGDYL